MTRRKAAWRGTSSIHTASSLARKARHLDRRNCSAAQVLNEMRKGATLHLSFSPREHWVLSSGAFVTDHVARAVIASRAVVGVGDTLIAGGPALTWRYAEENQ